MIDETKEQKLKVLRKFVDVFTTVLLIMAGGIMFGYKPSAEVSFIYAIVFIICGGFVFAAGFDQKWLFPNQRRMVISFNSVDSAVFVILIIVTFMFATVASNNVAIFPVSFVLCCMVFVGSLMYFSRYEDYGKQILHENACNKYQKVITYESLDGVARQKVDKWLSDQPLSDIELRIKEARKLVAMQGALKTYKFFHE